MVPELLEHAEYLMPFAKYAYNLEFQECPDYNKIRFFFIKILLDQDQVPSDDFEWNKAEVLQRKVEALEEKGHISKEMREHARDSEVYAQDLIERCKNLITRDPKEDEDLLMEQEPGIPDDESSPQIPKLSEYQSNTVANGRLSSLFRRISRSSRT